MIDYKEFTLTNGLRILINEYADSSFATVNVLYNVGSKDEHEEKTGFAHLFEHLMFGGSKHVANFDAEVDRAGGSNNAYTNTDITNYYISLPAQNIETAFWLESDRMLELNFNQQSLDVQKSVVIEEFKQRYLNQPYGDIWLLLRPLAFKTHPYKWATIGKEISHIEHANLTEVKDFFYSHYAPNNAILAVSGNVKTKKIMQLAEKWFGSISSRTIAERNLPKEPKQTEHRLLKVERDVPSPVIQKAFHIHPISDANSHIDNIISDILGYGRSSRLISELMDKKTLFFSIRAYVTDEIDGGLLVISAIVAEGVDIETADKAIDDEIYKLQTELISDQELQKFKNKIHTYNSYSTLSVESRAESLATHALRNTLEEWKNLTSIVEAITPQDVQRVAQITLQKTNESTLYYMPKNK